MGNISYADQQTVIEQFNATDDATTLGHCLHHLLQHAADNHVDKTAVICAETELTFGGLDTRANRFARILIEQGIGRGDLVGIALDRSVDLVVVLVAVLKTGAAYVPIDPAFPADRICHMLGDAGPKLVIIEASTQKALSYWRGARLNIDEARDKTGNSGYEESNIEVDVRADDLAYVIYTSGSTGKPKGVEVSHGALSNLLCAMQRDPGCAETDRLLALTTISFDIAFLEMFLPLLCGATIVIAQTHEAKDPGALLDLVQRHGITMMQGTPATWQMLLDAGWHGEPRLSKILCGGDRLPRQLAERLLHCAESVWNMYGPTETTVWASVWKVRRGHDMIIGRPIANYRLYVLGDDLAPVPLGCDGELYIGGAGLARGYHNKPETTQSRFLNNPFGEGRLYRTGDLARFEYPKNLVVIGRADGQVKVRGYRIELGDIEAAIVAHGDVSEAVVVSKDDRLVAYCLRAVSVSIPGEEACKPTLNKVLRPWLAERLPAYMIPAFFVELGAFPMTLNNKIDRKALPDPAEAIQPVPARPVTEMHRTIRLIWSSVLGHDRIGIHDNFFQIGGDSVRVVRVQSELERLLGRPLSPAKLFEHYTIKTLAAYLHGVGKSDPEPILPQRRLQDNEDIAVISMACRLPGGITTPEEYWELLERGADATTNVPKDRWDADALYDVNPDACGKSYCRRGGFLTSIDDFDASFFGISPREARAMDPAQRVMLETCWEGLERAGYTVEQLRGSQTGVYIGVCNISAHSSAQTLTDLDGYAVTGSAGGTMSGRVSYVFGFEGPTLTVDTACSSSLVATHLACNALRQGECDMAVSGGVTLLLTPGMHVEFSRLRGMSADGRSRGFAADTQGTGWSEGCTMVVLKRLRDAVRDGDVIHAVLRGTAVNHVGRSAAGLTVPSAPAQQRLIRTALAASELTPDDIDYIEAHGTGTKLGDPIEGAALAAVFGRSRADESEPLWVGSAKSNIGHTQAAAGLAGMLKVTLAMRNNRLPKTLHADKPTPAVDWQNAKMALVQESQPWLSQGYRPRRAGISAFGIGGTNAHAIVEEPPLQKVDSKPVLTPLPPKTPFLLSAHTDAALCQQAEKLQRYIQKTSKDSQDRLDDVAYSLATTRNHFRQRLVIMAKDKAELLATLGTVSKALPTSNHVGEPRLAMLFTGQGSQISCMGKDLYEVYPVFRDALNKITAQFTELERQLIEVMQAAPGSDAAALLQRTDFAQPAIFALEVALWHLWKSWGVQPDLAFGHSVGELAAAHVAGILDLSDACRLVAARGRLMQAVSIRGSMVSLEASAEEVTTAIEVLNLDGKVDIAGHNTPTQTVASGDADGIERLAAYFSGEGRKIKLLNVSHAFHSHHMDSMLAAFQAVAETVQFHPPRLPVLSSLTGKLAKAGQLEQAEYWVRQARRTVRFADGIRTLCQQGVNIFLELGPQPVLAGMGAACLEADESVAWMPSLVPGQHGVSVVQRSLADLHVRHVRIDWAGYFEPFGCCQRVELPTYAFQRQHFPRSLGMLDGKYTGNITNGVHVPVTATNGAISRGHGLQQQQQEQPAQADAVDRLQFEISWQRADTADANVAPGGSWGLLCPAGHVICACAWAREVKTALARAGFEIRQVGSLEDAVELDGLVCLWETESDDENVVRRAHDLTAKALAQLQTAAQTQFAPSLLWVTRRAVGAGADDDRVTGLAAGPLWGLIRTARSEHPELRLRLIDLDEETAAAPKALAAALMLSAEPECAVRQEQVLVPRMRPVNSVPKPPATQPLLRSGGAVLITGGLGDLGQRVARWLATAHGIRDLVLISRRGMKAPGAKKLVAELAGLGAKAAVVACDMADFHSIKSVMAMFNENLPLRGVVHAAGAQDNGIVTALTPQRCATAFAPKVDGAWHLHQLTRDLDLDLFVMFSSTFGVMGMPGHGNYAAANTFLDILAHLRRTHGLPATSVAYGAWKGEGMAAGMIGTGTLAHLTQLGLDMLTPEEGLELFGKAVRSRRALTVATALDAERLQNYYEERGGIPPLFRALLGQGSERVHRGWDLRRALNEAASDQHANIVLSMVRETVAKALGFAQPGDVDVNRPLQDIGIDSFTAVLMRNQLANLTGLMLTARFAFQHRDLKALSQFLLSELQGNESDRSPASETPWLNMAAIKKGCLDPGFTFDNAAQATAPPRSIFVTGATGFVGAFILYELLKSGIAAHCLVRADYVDQGRQRLLATLAGYGLWKPEYAQLLHPVVGDMTEPLLGLSQETFDHLADCVDAICHSGALVDWVRPLEDYIGPNIVSVHEVLRLASCGRGKAVHLISTMSTIPKYMGYEVTEKDQEYGYATSKYIAEQMVAAARWRGARASVYRLPFVTASSTTGHFRLDRGDFLHNLIAGSLEMGAFPSLNADLSAVLPVDYVGKTIVAVMTQDYLHRIGQDYDLANARAPSFNHFFKLMGAASAGQEIEPFSIWRKRASAYGAAHRTSPLARISALLDDVTDDDSVTAMVTSSPLGEHVFGAHDYPVPLIDEQYVQKYVNRIHPTGGKT
ncbi:hypothetical protein DL768_003913 [Monosporascus sp. mg162]|nr:hypothetical protein DL768_003913 [Monosporascus sp. mg162]